MKPKKVTHNNNAKSNLDQRKNFVKYLSLSSTLKSAPPNPESTKFHTCMNLKKLKNITYLKFKKKKKKKEKRKMGIDDTLVKNTRNK